jgi:hypothetical protein
MKSSSPDPQQLLLMTRGFMDLWLTAVVGALSRGTNSANDGQLSHDPLNLNTVPLLGTLSWYTKSIWTDLHDGRCCKLQSLAGIYGIEIKEDGKRVN